jgi:hypothetical protein
MHTCIAYVAESKTRSEEKQVMQSDQDVQVHGIFETLELPLYDCLYALFLFRSELSFIFSFLSFLFSLFSHVFEHALIFFSSFCIAHIFFFAKVIGESHNTHGVFI